MVIMEKPGIKTVFNKPELAAQNANSLHIMETPGLRTISETWHHGPKGCASWKSLKF